MHRRHFLKTTGITGAGLVLGFSKALGAIVNMGKEPGPDSFAPSSFIIIPKTGPITIMNPRPEMGQGTFQSIPALIAEELEVPLEAVIIRQTNGEKVFGDQSAGGSNSVRGSFKKLREVGATAREMLLKAAASQWQVPVEECAAEGGRIVHRPSGKSLAYGELVEAASGLEVPKEPKLKDPKDFKILGRSVPRPDVPLKTAGKAVFGIDAEVPGMLYASVERCPVLGGKLVDFDGSGALNVPGVQQVVKAERVFGKNRYTGVAVVATNYWAALQGRKALKVQWDTQGFDTFDSKAYEQSLRDAARTEGVVAHQQGDFDKTFSEAPVQLEAFYETPMVTHSPMEPLNCLAHWKEDGQVEVWTSTQVPGPLKGGLAKTFGIPEEKVTVHTLLLGGGFGRRLAQDYVIEAVNVSKAVGKPVKVIWTREDDTRQGPFRPMTFSAMKGALSADGQALAFQHKVISPSISAVTNEKYDRTKADRGMTEGISEQKYEIPHMKNLYVFSETHVPLTYWRSVTSSTLAFAHECFMDEMAVKAGKDPLAFRLSLMTKDSDAKRVLTKLKEVSGWDKPLPKGWGRGVAQWEFFAGLCGQVVEVSRQPDGSVKIRKVYAVIDLGMVVNPDNVKAQIEGSVVMALGAATKDAVVIQKGRTVTSNFHNNRMMRINEMPPVEVHILAEGGRVKGVGEPGLPPFAPALANAVFAATGKRVRKLPFDLGKI